MREASLKVTKVPTAAWVRNCRIDPEGTLLDLSWISHAPNTNKVTNLRYIVTASGSQQMEISLLSAFVEHTRFSWLLQDRSLQAAPPFLLADAPGVYLAFSVEIAFKVAPEYAFLLKPPGARRAFPISFGSAFGVLELATEKRLFRKRDSAHCYLYSQVQGIDLPKEFEVTYTQDQHVFGTVRTLPEIRKSSQT